jgi:hypothetical protein
MEDIVINRLEIKGGHGSWIPGASTVLDGDAGDDAIAGWCGGQNH